MLENGREIRFIQAMLGHASLSTTEIYTRVSTQQLKAVHERTHPARLTPRRNSPQRKRRKATQPREGVDTTGER